MRNCVDALAKQVGGAAQDGGAFHGRTAPPDLKAGDGGGNGVVEVGFTRFGGRTNGLAGGGVEHADGTAGASGAPFAVNEELDVFHRIRALTRQGVCSLDLACLAVHCMPLCPNGTWLRA